MSSSTSASEPVVVEGSTRREALEQGAHQLGLTPEQVRAKVVQQGRTGWFGLFQKPWRLKVFPNHPSGSLRDAAVEQAMKAAEGVDGSFHLEVDQRRIFLTVHPPEGTGDPVEPEAVIEHFNQIGLTYCDYERVREVVQNANGTAQRVGELPPDEDIDASYEVEVSGDELSATLTLYPPRFSGDPPSMEEARTVVQEQGVTEGIDWDTVRNMVEERRYNQTVEIARGRPPEPGTDGHVEYHFDTESRPRFTEEEGRIDFRNLGLIQNVEKGDPLAEKKPPTPGHPGITVRGESIEASHGEDVELNPGQNVYQEDDRLFASIDGQVLLQDNTVVVQEVHRVEGDVDYHTGNIDFNGTVVVEGNVRDRFKVKAQGDIVVEQGVGKAYLQSENDIVVKGGIRGKGGGQVNARGNIVVEFVEQGHLISQKNVLVDEMILHSYVDAGEGVYVSGKRGLLAGGRVRAGAHVFAREVGSIGSSGTELEVGIDPVFFREVSKIELKIMEQKEKLDKIERAIQTLEGRDERTEDDESRLEKLQQSREKLERNIENFREEQDTLLAQASEREGASVSVQGTIHTGTRVVIGDEVNYIHKTEWEHCTFRKRDNEIELMSYEEPEIPSL